MTIRLLVFLSALPFMLLGMPGALQAQQQETGPAGRRVIIFVWDGLRADELTPEIAPNYFALARSGVVFADHHERPSALATAHGMQTHFRIRGQQPYPR
jgi:predicted AlkP superfamily pyrophosphatase or phosphodiesterase